METEGPAAAEISGKIFQRHGRTPGLFLFVLCIHTCWVWGSYLSISAFQSCDIKSEGRKRFLTLKNVQLDQAGEVSYQALNAVTSAMLTVKGTNLSDKPAFCGLAAVVLLRERGKKKKSVCAFVSNC